MVRRGPQHAGMAGASRSEGAGAPKGFRLMLEAGPPHVQCQPDIFANLFRSWRREDPEGAMLTIQTTLRSWGRRTVNGSTVAVGGRQARRQMHGRRRHAGNGQLALPHGYRSGLPRVWRRRMKNGRRDQSAHRERGGKRDTLRERPTTRMSRLVWLWCKSMRPTLSPQWKSSRHHIWRTAHNRRRKA